MNGQQMLAGIIRICPQLAPAGEAEPTLADLFETWGDSATNVLLPPRMMEHRLAGTLAGPRQHKLRANLDRIQAELERELAEHLRATDRQ